MKKKKRSKPSVHEGKRTTKSSKKYENLKASSKGRIVKNKK